MRPSRLTSPVKRRSGNEVVNRVVAYMEENVCGSLTFSDICRYSAQKRHPI